jgi:predicted transcriptional regulator
MVNFADFAETAESARAGIVLTADVPITARASAAQRSRLIRLGAKKAAGVWEEDMAVRSSGSGLSLQQV